VTDRSHDDRRKAHEVARRERLHLAIADMDYAAAAARWLHGEPFELAFVGAGGTLPHEVRMVLEAGLFVVYARAFNTSRGSPPLPAAPTNGLNAEQREIHKWALARRDEVAAHVDRDAEGRQFREVSITMHQHGLQPLEVNGPAEHYRPPSPEQLLALAELAETLAARYRAEVS
jgi:hypothetical protein